MATTYIQKMYGGLVEQDKCTYITNKKEAVPFETASFYLRNKLVVEN